MNTIEDIVKWIEDNKIVVNIFYRLLMENKWRVTFEKKDDGIHLKVDTESTDLFTALYDAYEKFYLTVNRGAGLLAPVIEHKTFEDSTPLNEAMARPSVNDDIPF